MYRRLVQNPNFYNLGGVEEFHINDFISETIENCLTQLQPTCITIASEEEIEPTNLGIISAYYSIST